MGNFVQKISRAGLVLVLIGAVLLWFSLGDAIISFKPAKSFDAVAENGMSAGDHVSGRVPFLLDSFATMETWSESRDGKSRTAAKTSSRYYVLFAGENLAGLSVGSSNFTAAKNLVDQTYGYFAGGAEPTAELEIDARVTVMEEELAELFREELRDYYGFTDQDISDMGPLLLVEPRAFTAVRVICAVGAVFFLAGVLVLVRRWRKIGAQLRTYQQSSRASYDPELN